MQRRCPHHGLPDWLIVQTFYNGLTLPIKTNVDAVAGGALMAKSPDKAKELIKEMAAITIIGQMREVTSRRNQVCMRLMN